MGTKQVRRLPVFFLMFFRFSRKILCYRHDKGVNVIGYSQKLQESQLNKKTYKKGKQNYPQRQILRGKKIGYG